MSDSVLPHGRQPTRLPCPWDSPGKNTGVGCHFLLQRVKVKSLSRVQLFTTPWTAAYQAPPSRDFSRQEYWSGLPLPSPLGPLVRCKHFSLVFKTLSVRTPSALNKLSTSACQSQPATIPSSIQKLSDPYQMQTLKGPQWVPTQYPWLWCPWGRWTMVSSHTDNCQLW